MSQTQKQRQKQQKKQQERNAAIAQATQSAQLDQAATGRSGTFISEMGDADITPGEDATGIEAHLAPELSRHHVFGYITREDLEGLKITNQALAMQYKAEHPRPTGPSSKCTGRYRKEMFGESTPVLTDDMAREADSVLGEEGVRTMMQSKSVEAMAFKGATQVQSRVMTGDNGGDSGGGMLSGLKDALGFGGDD